MKKGIIYRAWSPSGKSYIGQTTQSLQVRKNKHRYAALTSRAALPFCHAIRCYGWKKIQWEVLRNNIPSEKLNDLEIQAIRDFNSFSNGYNCSLGGEGQPGRKHSAQSKRKITTNHWARCPDTKQVTIEKIKLSRQGQLGHPSRYKDMKLGPRSEETKRKISLGNKRLPKPKGPAAPFFGKQHTKNTKLKISRVLRNRELSYRKLSRVQKEEIKNLYMTKEYRQIDLAELY